MTRRHFDWITGDGHGGTADSGGVSKNGSNKEFIEGQLVGL